MNFDLNSRFMFISAIRVAVFGAIIAFVISVVGSGVIGWSFIQVSNWTMIAVIVFSAIFLLLMLLAMVAAVSQAKIGPAFAFLLMAVMWVLNVFSYTVGFAAYETWFVDPAILASTDRYLVDEARYWILRPVDWLSGGEDPLAVIQLYELQTFYGTVAAGVLVALLSGRFSKSDA